MLVLLKVIVFLLLYLGAARSFIFKSNPKMTKHIYYMRFNDFKIQAPVMNPMIAGGLISAGRTEFLQSFEIYTCSEASKTLIGRYFCTYKNAKNQKRNRSFITELCIS